jgi:hypothetical protein
MKLIDKDAVVAEIERIKLIIGNPFCLNNIAKASWVARKDTCEDILSFLDTLEVKEVDLEKEIQTFSMELAMKENNGDWEKDIRTTAKYFFELGLKAQKGE